MDGSTLSISPSDLYARLGAAAAPVLIDVRHRGSFDSDDGCRLQAQARRPAAGATA